MEMSTNDLTLLGLDYLEASLKNDSVGSQLAMREILDVDAQRPGRAEEARSAIAFNSTSLALVIFLSEYTGISQQELIDYVRARVKRLP